MKTPKPHNLTWRNGRPRWTPGPSVRKLGFAGFDLKTVDGKWMSWEAACAAASKANEAVAKVRPPRRLVLDGDDVLEQQRARESKLPRFRSEEKLAASRFRKGYVYFVWAGPSIKIGFSITPSRRLKALETSVSEPICRIAVLPGTLAAEKRLHRRFEKHRSHGEWFRRSAQLEEILFQMIKEGTTDVP